MTAALGGARRTVARAGESAAARAAGNRGGICPPRTRRRPSTTKRATTDRRARPGGTDPTRRVGVRNTTAATSGPPAAPSTREAVGESMNEAPDGCRGDSARQLSLINEIRVRRRSWLRRSRRNDSEGLDRFGGHSASKSRPPSTASTTRLSGAGIGDVRMASAAASARARES